VLAISPERIKVSVKILTHQYPSIARAVILTLLYAVWCVLFHLMSMTFVTYFVAAAAHDTTARFEDINEAYSTIEFGIYALGSVLFVLMLKILNPLPVYAPGERWQEFFTVARFEKRFLPGFLNGSVLAGGIILAFLLSGLYQYLGFFVQVDEGPIALAQLSFRIACIAVLTYSEEFIFRGRILRNLQAYSQGAVHDLWAIFFTGIFYTGIKFLQFDLSWMQGITLLLLSASLALRTLSEKDFIFGAGLLTALLVILQPLCSLPIFGNEFSGFLMVKYQALASNPHSVEWTFANTRGEILRFFSGGEGGPLAAFAFQLLLAFDIGRSLVRHKKILSHDSSEV
jgi:hypothetical protein